MLADLAPMFGGHASWVQPVRRAASWVGALLAHWRSEGLDSSTVGGNPELEYRRVLLDAHGAPVPSKAPPEQVLLDFWLLGMRRFAEEYSQLDVHTRRRVEVVRFDRGAGMLPEALTLLPQGVPHAPPIAEAAFQPRPRAMPAHLTADQIEATEAAAASAWDRAGLAWPWAADLRR